jgi:hypothetical protein
MRPVLLAPMKMNPSKIRQPPQNPPEVGFVGGEVGAGDGDGDIAVEEGGVVDQVLVQEVRPLLNRHHLHPNLFGAGVAIGSRSQITLEFRRCTIAELRSNTNTNKSPTFKKRL